MKRGRKKDDRPLTLDLLKEKFVYDPLSGVFTHLRNHATVKAGQQAGSLDNRGYRQIVINGKFYYAHRLAWLWMTGKIPDFEIDHVNLNKDDNSWGNLRASDRSKNNANRLSKNPLGKGVRKEGSKFRATIQSNKVQYRSCLFDTPEEAYAAYVEMAQREFGEHARF